MAELLDEVKGERVRLCGVLLVIQRPGIHHRLHTMCLRWGSAMKTSCRDDCFGTPYRKRKLESWLLEGRFCGSWGACSCSNHKALLET